MLRPPCWRPGQEEEEEKNKKQARKKKKKTGGPSQLKHSVSTTGGRSSIKSGAGGPSQLKQSVCTTGGWSSIKKQHLGDRPRVDNGQLPWGDRPLMERQRHSRRDSHLQCSRRLLRPPRLVGLVRASRPLSPVLVGLRLLRSVLFSSVPRTRSPCVRRPRHTTLVLSLSLPSLLPPLRHRLSRLFSASM